MWTGQVAKMIASEEERALHELLDSTIGAAEMRRDLDQVTDVLKAVAKNLKEVVATQTQINNDVASKHLALQTQHEMLQREITNVTFLLGALDTRVSFSEQRLRAPPPKRAFSDLSSLGEFADFADA
jgi:hypothetical protein